MMKSTKKGQAALEFLTTYGWAFIVIIIMIGAMAYFGILNPRNLLPDRCSFGTEIGCEDFLLSANGDDVRLRLKNNVGEVIKVTEINFTSDSATSFTCTGAPSLPNAWTSGTIEDLAWDTCNWDAAGVQAGNKEKIKIKLTYHTLRSGSNYPHVIQGEIFGGVQ